MNRKPIVAVCAVALVLQGCATASKDLTAIYVSPLQYQGYDCGQIRAETQRIQTRVLQLGGRLDEAANNDKGIMAVGLIIFWPALFALGGTKQQEAEYSRLKGEYDALEQQAVIEKCPGITPPITATAAVAPTAAAPVTLAPAAVIAAPPAVVTPVATEVLPVAAARLVGLSGESRHMFSAERFAKASGCMSPVAAMSLRAPDSETFTITCAAGDPMIIRCDGSACREMK